MFRDELKQPLRKRSVFQRIWAKRPGLLFLAYTASFGALAGLFGWASKQPMPFAGEPVVVVSVPPPEVITTSSEAPPKTPAEEQMAETEAIDTGDEDVVSGPETMPDPDMVTGSTTKNGRDVGIVESPIADTYQQEAMVVVSPRRPLAPAPQPALVEESNWGPLPRISADGEKPSKAYARRVSLSVIHSSSPKIALVLGGMGLNRKLTQRAIADLPADVTLAFAPYGENLQEQVDKARDEGHEVVLQVPLEPIGYPAQSPGPHTLTGEATESENIDSLRWHLGRFAGYAGVQSYMGTRFLSMAPAIKPVLGELKKRGLFFLEDGSLALSATEGAARDVRADVRRAKLVIDADPSPQAILAALTTLEEQATGTGFAIGTGSGLGVTIDTVKEWAKAAAERGIILVPVSAAYQGRKG